MQEIDWHEQAKRLLKSELVRRGITNDELVRLLENIDVKETKASIDSKISRGAFSAGFLLQCLNAIGCRTLLTEIEVSSVVEEARIPYRTNKPKSKKIGQ